MRTLILGLGNPIQSDDSVGLRVARALQDKLASPEITVMEASVAGLDALELLAGYDQAVIIDAIQTDTGHVGWIYRLEPDALNATSHAATPHDVNFATALELGSKLGLALPHKITVFAIEAGDVTSFTEECTPEVSAAIPLCVDMILQELGEQEKCKHG